MQHSLIQFVKRERKNKHGQVYMQFKGYSDDQHADKIFIPVLKKVGVFFAFKLKDSEGIEKICIGVAKTHLKDIFSAKTGKALAMGKAMESLEKGIDIPYSFAEDFIEFKERCKRYFKYETQEWKDDAPVLRNAIESDFVEIRIGLFPAEKRKLSERHLVKHD